MLETVRGVVGNEREHFFFFPPHPQLSLRFMGRHDSLGRHLNHDITGLGAGSPEYLGSYSQLGPSPAVVSGKLISPP